jgi:hypothetical protein
VIVQREKYSNQPELWRRNKCSAPIAFVLVAVHVSGEVGNSCPIQMQRWRYDLIVDLREKKRSQDPLQNGFGVASDQEI